MAVSATTGSGGLDVESLVSQLMAIEKRPLTALDTKIAKNTSNAQYLASFKTTVTTFEASLAALRDSSRIASTTATSSDTSAVTATTSSGAAAADIDVKVIRTAQPARVALAGFTSASQAPGSGTLALTVGTPPSASLNVDLSQSATMSDLVTNINVAAAGAIPSVPLKASLVQTGTGAWSLIISGTHTGAANTVGLNAAPTPPATFGTTQTQLQAPRDAVVLVDGLQVTSASNTISNVVPGVVLQLRKSVDLAPDGAAASIDAACANAPSVMVSIAQNAADIHTLANSVVTGFNAMMDYYSSLTKTNVDPTLRGPMSGNSSLAAMMSTARNSLAQGMTDASGNTFRFADMGVELNSDGHLALNEANFTTAMTNGLAAKLAAGVSIPLDTYLGKMVLSGGDLGTMEASLTTSKATLQKTRDDLSDRLTVVEASLRARYASLDAQLYKLNNINTALTSSLASLSNNNSNK